MPLNWKLIALTAALPLLGAGIARANAYPTTQPAQMTMAQAKATALAVVPGHVTSSVLQNAKGWPRFVFDIASNGQTHVVGIDGITGKLAENKLQTNKS